jgi:hypothetical protein
LLFCSDRTRERARVVPATTPTLSLYGPET